MIIISNHNHNWLIHCEVLPLPSLLDTLCYAGFMETSQVNVNLNLWQLKEVSFPKNTSKPKERSGWRPSTGLSQKLPCKFKVVDATSLKFKLWSNIYQWTAALSANQKKTPFCFRYLAHSVLKFQCSSFALWDDPAVFVLDHPGVSCRITRDYYSPQP